MTSPNCKRNLSEIEKDQNPTDKGVSDSCFFMELPISISHEIFFKLPIKDVMRCKCVCTEWKTLLSKPNFSQNYGKNSPFSSIFHCTDSHYLMKDPSVRDSHPHVSYLFEISENGDYSKAPYNPKLPGWMRKGWSVFFVGSCNGFLCMNVYKLGLEVIYVTDPIMGDSIALPERERDKDGHGVAIYNFGFSPDMNRFKVLRISFRTFFDRKNPEECEIFTVGVDDTWRSLPNSFTGLCFYSTFVSLNGVIYGISWKENDIGLISTFDLAEEKFGQISMPPTLLLPVSDELKLAVFGTQLGLVDSSVSSHISIWKMEKYSAVDSWDKVVVLRSWFPEGPLSRHLRSVTGLQNGEMLFSYFPNDLVTCNIELKKCSKIEVDTKLYSRSILTYTPNFSSRTELIMKGHKSTVDVQSK